MAPKSKRNGKIDEEIEETFPASDPPSFMGGEVLGAPKGRHTPRRKAKPMKKARKKPAKKTVAKRPSKKAKKKKTATKRRKTR
jgi:hypothetical protein